MDLRMSSYRFANQGDNNLDRSKGIGYEIFSDIYFDEFGDGLIA